MLMNSILQITFTLLLDFSVSKHSLTDHYIKGYSRDQNKLKKSNLTKSFFSVQSKHNTLQVPAGFQAISSTPNSFVIFRLNIKR